MNDTEFLVYVNQIAALVADLDPRVSFGDGSVAWIDLPFPGSRSVFTTGHYYAHDQHAAVQAEADHLRSRHNQ